MHSNLEERHLFPDFYCDNYSKEKKQENHVTSILFVIEASACVHWGQHYYTGKGGMLNHFLDVLLHNRIHFFFWSEKLTLLRNVQGQEFS